MSQPSVLLISADDLPRNILGVYGAQHGLTPNLDQLGKESLTFDRAYVQVALCGPSRESSSAAAPRLRLRLRLPPRFRLRLHLPPANPLARPQATPS